MSGSWAGVYQAMDERHLRDSRWIGAIDGVTLLHVAVQEGHFRLVQALLVAGAVRDINAAMDVDWATPLHIAVENGRLDIVNALLVRKEKLNLNPIMKKGRTPLYMAAQKGHVEIIRALLAAGADIYGGILVPKFPGTEFDQILADYAFLNPDKNLDKQAQGLTEGAKEIILEKLQLEINKIQIGARDGSKTLEDLEQLKNRYLPLVSLHRKSGLLALGTPASQTKFEIALGKCSRAMVREQQEKIYAKAQAKNAFLMGAAAASAAAAADGVPAVRPGMSADLDL